MPTYIRLRIAELRMRQSPSIIPSDRLDRDIYLVLEDFSAGAAWRETDEGETDVSAIVEDLLTGQYEQPLRVVVFNPVERWSRDASGEIAEELDRRISAEGREVSEALQEFVESNIGRKIGVHWPCRSAVEVAMAKSKSPPENPASFDQLMELAPLFMDLYDFVRTSNELDNIDATSTMILATVTVGDADGQPMTAQDIAFFLGTPVRTVKSKLKRLMKTGIIDAGR
jgi:hypothetical protein